MKLSELKNGTVVELRNKKRYLILDGTLLNLKDFGEYIGIEQYNNEMLSKTNKQWDIMKVNNKVKNTYGYSNFALFYVYKFDRWNWERNKIILDNVEKRYLKAVCRPYDIESIAKRTTGNMEYLDIIINHKKLDYSENIYLPHFPKGEMYKGMKLDKEYTLKELELED